MAAEPPRTKPTPLYRDRRWRPDTSCSLAAAIAAVSPDPFEDLRRNIDPGWVVQALEATGTATVRSRRLPAEQVVWLVIGMALFRNRWIHDVVGKLDLALPGISPAVAPSSVAQVRTRLGPDPMEWLFTICAERWGSCERSQPSLAWARAGRRRRHDAAGPRLEGQRGVLRAPSRSICGISASRSRHGSSRHAAPNAAGSREP